MSGIGIGSALREAREEQGRAVTDVAAATAMRAEQVEALETERFEIFGGDVYAKGFLKSYARDVGLDPEPLLSAYRRHVQQTGVDSRALTAGPVTDTSPRPGAPAWLGWAAGIGLLVAVVVVVSPFIGSRTPDAVVAEPSSPPAPVETAEPDPEPTPEPTPTPDPEPEFVGVNVTLVFEEDSWVRVTADGQPLQEGLQQAGDALDVTAANDVVVRVGNAGGVRARLNGETLGVLGERGDVVDVRFTESGLEVV